jgi:hypothetical protein
MNWWITMIIVDAHCESLLHTTERSRSQGLFQRGCLKQGAENNYSFMFLPSAGNAGAMSEL